MKKLRFKYTINQTNSTTYQVRAIIGALKSLPNSYPNLQKGRRVRVADSGFLQKKKNTALPRELIRCLSMSPDTS